MIPRGVPIVFDVAGDVGQWVPRTVADVRKDAIDALSADFDVVSVSVTRTTGLLDDPLNLYYWEWPYTASVVASPRSDYGDIRDVDSVVAHAFYTAAGQLPTVTSPQHGEPSAGHEIDPGTGISSTLKWIAITAIVLAAALIVFEVRR